MGNQRGGTGVFINPAVSLACTNILVTKGAPAEGSVMITYACDGEYHAIFATSQQQTVQRERNMGALSNPYLL